MKSWPLGTATDCYQPIEGFYKLTRGVLEAFCDFSTPTGVVTKGPMVVRDKDVLVDLSAKTDVHVCVSVPCVDEDVWRALEPGTAHSACNDCAQSGNSWTAGITRGVLDEPDRPRHLIEAGAARAHGQSDRGPRRALHRLQRDVPGGRHTRSLHALACPGIPASRRRIRAALRRQVSTDRDTGTR